MADAVASINRMLKNKEQWKHVSFLFKLKSFPHITHNNVCNAGVLFVFVSVNVSFHPFLSSAGLFPDMLINLSLMHNSFYLKSQLRDQHFCGRDKYSKCHQREMKKYIFLFVNTDWSKLCPGPLQSSCPSALCCATQIRMTP